MSKSIVLPLMVLMFGFSANAHAKRTVYCYGGGVKSFSCERSFSDSVSYFWGNSGTCLGAVSAVNELGGTCYSIGR